mmetsp:Transcript_13002/g.40036  ORF Transcript_13002/g.40036 Transcript_13002/m.40036 type:complete len:345 (-) Transcript_13002:113-1147(-)
MVKTADFQRHWSNLGRKWPTSDVFVGRIAGQPVENWLPRLYDEVCEKRGGYDAVNDCSSWGDVRNALGLAKGPTTTNFALQRIYADFALEFEREQRKSLEKKARRLETGVLVKVNLPCEDSQEKNGWFWGCIVGMHVLSRDMDILLDDRRRLVRLPLAKVRYEMGYLCKHVKTYVASAADLPLFRLDPERKTFYSVGKEAMHSTSTIDEDMEEEAQRSNHFPMAGEIVNCCCGWNKAEGTMVQCQDCRQWSHQFCTGESSSQSSKCFACNPLAVKGGSLAEEVAKAILRVRSQPKWRCLNLQLAQTQPRVQTQTRRGERVKDDKTKIAKRVSARKPTRRTTRSR